MIFHGDGGNPVFEVSAYSEGLGAEFIFTGRGTRMWLTDANGYKVVDPNVIIKELSGPSVDWDWSLLLSYNRTKTPGGYTLHIVGIDPGIHLGVNRTVVKFIGYQNQI